VVKPGISLAQESALAINGETEIADPPHVYHKNNAVSVYSCDNSLVLAFLCIAYTVFNFVMGRYVFGLDDRHRVSFFSHYFLSSRGIGQCAARYLPFSIHGNVQMLTSLLFSKQGEFLARLVGVRSRRDVSI
jgi:hypothetical protein